MCEFLRKQLQRGFEVEWITNVPKNEYGDFDIDSGVYNSADFESAIEAVEHAKKVAHLDYFNSPLVHEFKLDMEGYREYIGDQIEI